ncbi:hypothetical protein D3C79_1076440 [compost metagenome]
MAPIISSIIVALYLVTLGLTVVVTVPPVATGVEAVAETNNLINEAAIIVHLLSKQNEINL